MAIAESFEIKNTNLLSEDDLNGHIVKLKTNSEELFAIAHSGSPMSFLNEKTARRIQQNDRSVLFMCIQPDDTARNLACYNGETINPKGRLIITIESGGWKIQSAPLIIVDDQKANIIGRNILPQIGVKLIKKNTNKLYWMYANKKNRIRNLNNGSKIIFNNYAYVSENKKIIMNTQFSQDFIPIQQKGRRIPVHLLEKIEGELNKLMNQNHIIKLDKCSDRQFNSPIVITVKKGSKSQTRVRF